MEMFALSGDDTADMESFGMYLTSVVSSTCVVLSLVPVLGNEVDCSCVCRTFIQNGHGPALLLIRWRTYFVFISKHHCVKNL